MVTPEQLRRLLSQPESLTLEFKREFNIRDSRRRAYLLRDILSFANSVPETAHLIIGIDGENKQLVGLSDDNALLDDANLQQLVNSYCTPPVKFMFQVLILDGVKLGVITVYPSDTRPHYLSREISGTFPENQKDWRFRENTVFVRRGSVTLIASPSEIVEIAKTKPSDKLISSPIISLVKLNLDIVANNEIRTIIRRDVEELNVAIAQGTDKSAKTCMVLCGSIAEAILLDNLLQQRETAISTAKNLGNKIDPDPERWDLFEMVTIATRMTPPLLPDDTIAGANQLREWRNLIHPGRELRDSRTKRISPTNMRARSAIVFLEFLAEELGL